MKDGIALAAELIDSGKALETLHKLIEVSNRPEDGRMTILGSACRTTPESAQRQAKAETCRSSEIQAAGSIPAERQISPLSAH